MTSNSEKYGVQQLKEQCFLNDLRTIVFSPGSRNAPLVIAFTQDERFTCYVIPDERSAAFYALGMAEQLQKPVAVACTSGSALLNYYPAVSEAFYRTIPLVIISADRPSEWTDMGDGQTIRQEGVFKNHIIDQTSLLESPKSENEKWFNQREIDRLLQKCKKGPVHINFPFNEPLYNLGDNKVSGTVQTELLELESILSSQQISKLSEVWNSSKRKLIICGQMSQNGYLQEQLKQLTKDSSVAVLVENTSNLSDRSFIHCIDRTINSITSDYPELFRPDLLITIGGAVISKKIKSYLRSNKPKNHWKIGNDFQFMDTFQSLTTSIPISPNTFLSSILESNFKFGLSRYGEQWKQLDYLIQDKHNNYFHDVAYSDLSVVQLLLDAIPEKSQLHFGNSSVIRYAQLFDPVQSIIHKCNRGTSGIDGSTSTALGNCLADPDHLHTFISGDISFFYDSNAFWNHHLPSNFRMFVINNGGGGIFNIIPGPEKSEVKEKYFVANQSFSAKSICEAFEVNYMCASSMDEIDSQLNSFFEIQSNERPVLMEIFTPREKNDEVLKDYFKKIKVKEIKKLEL
ncbi:MAG: 2-succinyl-5-enolpyruvyl-6-hydroxy-3-cyclohexene-1-carboxylic-acid synthase [Fluviicola sp.]|nr:MAG: 2-succinyl-5-enolpyruvyl-6-hydroxy-3-cyclohexene-1-carboxylic-acid synthase [Fluviicola sp.]